MKTLKKFEFPASAAQSTYDWAKLLDGGIYEMTSGEDYTCADQTLRMMCYKNARKLGKHVKVAKVDTGLVIQATDADQDTIDQWAIEDAERKEAAKAAKAAKSEEGETETEPEGEEEAPVEEAPVAKKGGKKGK